MDWTQREWNDWRSRGTGGGDDAQRALELRQEQLGMERQQQSGDQEALARAIAKSQAKDAAAADKGVVGDDL